MNTVEVSNAYNIRRKHLAAELEYAEKDFRGLLTRSVLNTDLSALTYEVLINSIVKIREFDRFKVLEIDKRYHEAKKWLSEYNDSINRIITNHNRKKLISTAQNLEKLLSKQYEHLPFLESFYIEYFDLHLSILEDALIQIYTGEDVSMIFNVTSKMLNDLVVIHPPGGLTPLIKGISETYNHRYAEYKAEDPYTHYIDLYCDTTFMWSQVSQLIIDYLNTISNGGQVALENSNIIIEDRMKHLVNRYQGLNNND